MPRLQSTWTMLLFCSNLTKIRLLNRQVKVWEKKKVYPAFLNEEKKKARILYFLYAKNITPRFSLNFSFIITMSSLQKKCETYVRQQKNMKVGIDVIVDNRIFS